MTLTLYGIPTCDTCRKARKALEGAGHTVTFRDVRAEPLARQEWEAMVQALGDGVVNRRAPSFRALDPALQDAAPVDLLTAAPVVMKRPVIRAGDDWHLGWTEGVRAALT